MGSCSQVSPGEALTKEELQSGVDVANAVAESYQKCMCTTNTLVSSLGVDCDGSLSHNCSSC